MQLIPWTYKISNGAYIHAYVPACEMWMTFIELARKNVHNKN